MLDHSHFLKRCFELAKLGESLCFPNPIVGCVIVHNGEIIGEGFHEYFGGPHAEVNAINNVIASKAKQSSSVQDWVTTSPTAPRDDDFNLTDSTIYISLEPCSHHGKTPPCTDLIIKHKFKTLVYASSDPNPLVAGKGIEKIKASGIEVIGPDELEPEIVREAEFLNRVFFKMMRRHREESDEALAKSDDVAIQSNSSTGLLRFARNDDAYWITLKIALTKDGRMITSQDEPRWITNSNARKDVHRLRSTHQLVISSYQTIIADDALYTVRYSPEELKLQKTKEPDIVIVKSENNFTNEQKSKLQIFQTENLRKVFEYKANDLKTFINEMVKNSYQKIMIEAGPKLSKAFIDANLVDEVIAYSPSNNFQENLKKLFNQDFNLIKIEEIKGDSGKENNFKAIFLVKK